MHEMLEPKLHRGGYTKSNGSRPVSSQDYLLDSLSSEIRNLRREINFMEGKYISLDAYYEDMVKGSLADL